MVRELEQRQKAIGLAHIRKTLTLLFVLFLLATSRKSTDSGKYCLLETINPLYFLTYFFYFLAYFLPVIYFLPALVFFSYFFYQCYLNRPTTFEMQATQHVLS